MTNDFVILILLEFPGLSYLVTENVAHVAVFVTYINSSLIHFSATERHAKGKVR